MMFFGQDHRHSSMDLGDELVGLPGYDCAGVQPLLSRRISSSTRTLYSANLSRSRSMDKESLSFSNNASGSLSLSWLTSSGSCILRGIKPLFCILRVIFKPGRSLVFHRRRGFECDSYRRIESL